MKTFLYNLLRRWLSQSLRSKLKQFLRRTRNRAKPFRLWLFGTFSPEDLHIELSGKLEDLEFDILMVHASMDSMRPSFTGNTYDVLGVLLDLASGKTLAMPAFFFGEPPTAYNPVEPPFDQFILAQEPSHKPNIQFGILGRRFKNIFHSLPILSNEHHL